MKLKYCGFRTLEDVKKAKDLNIDAMGFIHYPKSKRYVDISTIKQLTDIIPNDKEKVVIVVNPEYKTLIQLIEQTTLTTIQFHGNETLELIHDIKLYKPTIKVIKALPATDYETLVKEIDYYQDSVDQFIFDTPSSSYGGTGRTYNWEQLKAIQHIDYLIAGGINYEHIKTIEALDLSHSGYDIASGIETNNEKDSAKMQLIVEHVKGENK
ncbi:phosphoribosylanthranilate isomerase [Staphylococcus succinus]|uniref:phosphoribosylanthranilate isomerase n=1 Tax=Staphylococcus succinus TaxID=61015 RepID=UPI000C325D3D|nr:phosphoribosylanthranilate isomerase [Staphylococcus succinus]PKI23139.1 phosphoribosylanthranilate isomerase [Staphylococcus succinus]PTI46832.1 phosphoribosylanthranilate isomerase [Staphylococcus succinus]PTJ81173.1 phosphoribosylanthranilate isomerase [Staphylococcus succinus]